MTYLPKPPHGDKHRQIAVGDPPLPAKLVGDEVSALDPPAYGFRRDLKALGHLIG